VAAANSGLFQFGHVHPGYFARQYFIRLSSSSSWLVNIQSELIGIRSLRKRFKGFIINVLYPSHLNLFVIVIHSLYNRKIVKSPSPRGLDGMGFFSPRKNILR